MQNLFKEELNKSILALFFIFTGLSGITYQVVSFKYLSFSLGNTAAAQTIILITFLGGLVIGNYFFGSKYKSISNPLKVFALLQISLGLFAAAFPILYGIFSGLFFSLVPDLTVSGSGVFYNLIRMLISVAILLFPAIVFGGTFPLLSSVFVDKPEDAGKDIGTLFFLNLFGVVIGMFLTGFIFIKKFGLEETVYITAMLSIVIGFIALGLSSKYGVEKLFTNLSGEKNNNLIKLLPTELKAVLFTTFLLGFTSFIYGKSFTRLFVVIFGSSTYVYSIVFIAFILGIAIGGFISSKSFFANKQRLFHLAALQFALAIGIILVLSVIERVPYYSLVIDTIFSKTEGAFLSFTIIEFIMVFILMFIPALVIGITLPLIIEVFSHTKEKISCAVGKVFSIFFAGTILGVLLTDLLFLQLGGFDASFNAGIVSNILAGVALIFSTNKISGIYKKGLLGFSVVIFIFHIFTTQGFGKNITLGSLLTGNNEMFPESYYEYQKIIKQNKVLFYEEGELSTVAVLETDGEEKEKLLSINGKVIVNNYEDKPTLILAAQIPLMLHEEPQNIFITGFNSGITVSSVLTHPVKKVICAEVSEEIINAGKIFDGENNNCLKDKRLKIIEDDANTVLNSSVENFDVIISEPNNIWSVNSNNLFTKDFLMTCKNKLDTNGIMVQTFRSNGMNDNVIKLLLNTFKDIFKYAQIWSGNSNEVILIGSKKRIKLNGNKLKEKFSGKKINKDFAKIDIDNVFTFLTCQFNSTEGFYTLTTNKKPINTELLPLLEFEAPQTFFMRNSSSFINDNDEKFDTLNQNVLAKQYIKLNEIKPDEYLNAAEYHFNKTHNYHFAFGVTNFLRKKFPVNFKVEKLYANCLARLDFENNNKSVLKKIVDNFPEAQKEKREYLNILLTEKLYATTFVNISSIDSLVQSFIVEASKDSSKIATTYLQLAKIYLQNSEIKKTEEMLKGLFAIVNVKPEVKETLPMDDYFYVSLMLAYYRDDMKSMLENFTSLLNTNSDYPNTSKFKGLINARMELGNMN